MLSNKEIARYSRHLLLPEIGQSGQEKFKNARVLVIGAGGLGCPVLMYLAAAGIGKIGIVDYDRVEVSNLQRQVLFDVNDIGNPKSEVAKSKLALQNPFVEIHSYSVKLDPHNAPDLFLGYDIIIDGTDNFSTRYLVNDACVFLGKTLVSGSIFKFQGQVSVFNHKDTSGKFGPSYRCLFPTPPPAGSMPSCSEIGVLGVLPGIVGALMANEVIKIIAGIGEILSGTLLLIDALSLNFHKVEISKNAEAMRTAPQNLAEFQKMDYDFFCGITNKDNGVKEISVQHLAVMMASGEDIQLLDVREIGEEPLVPELGGLKIPLGSIEVQKDLISRSKNVVVICRSGARSRRAIEVLSSKYGFSNLRNLKGGVMEWINLLNEKQRL